jgi:hypothetical protein
MTKSIFGFLLTVSQIIVLNTTATFGQQPHDPTENLRLEWSDSVSVGVEEKGWRFVVELYKPKTAWCESIYIRNKITNLYDYERVMPNLTFYTRARRPDISFKIINSKGEEFIPGFAHFDAFGERDINAMKKGPGENEVYDYDLFWWGGKGFKRECYMDCLPPEEYVTYISLYTDPLHQAPREENTITLPPLKFTVVEPTGDSAEAFRLLCLGRAMRFQEPTAAEPYYDSILTYYSHTPYDERTNNELIHHRLRYGFDRQELVRWRERYFLKYLNTPLSQKNVNELIPRISQERMKELTRSIQDKPEAAIILKHLKEHHPWIFEDD